MTNEHEPSRAEPTPPRAPCLPLARSPPYARGMLYLCLAIAAYVSVLVARILWLTYYGPGTWLWYRTALLRGRLR